MIKIGTKKATNYTLVAEFDKPSKDVIKKKNAITEFISQKKSVIYLGKKKDFDIKELKNAAIAIVAANKRGFNIDAQTFISPKMDLNIIVKFLIQEINFLIADVWSLKAKSKDKKQDFIIINALSAKKAAMEAELLAEEITWVRSHQTMPPNILNSVNFAKEIQNKFSKIQNVSVKILTLPEIKKLGMNLIVGVNRGSEHDARLVILEYKGDVNSKQKTAMIGKGIMFDSGGQNLKTGPHQKGMKYDMSGAAIVAGTMMAISKLKPKANISAIMPLTSNRIGKLAQLPDSVWKSMSGKTVEINNTDAEGRLVMADAITYAIKKLSATKIIDIATLTGAVLVALGNTFSGVWATNQEFYERFEKSAKTQSENIWRMPFHDSFIKFMKDSKVADLKNTNLTGLGGSSSAAGFLKEFTEKLPYIHLDIAGTADIKETPMAPLLKTLAKLY